MKTIQAILVMICVGLFTAGAASAASFSIDRDGGEGTFGEDALRPFEPLVRRA